MSGFPEVGEHPMSILRDTDPDTIALAEANIARRALREGWTYDQIVDALEHLGLRAPEKPGGGHTTPQGRNVPPKVQQHRRDQSKARRRASRDDGKETT